MGNTTIVVTGKILDIKNMLQTFSTTVKVVEIIEDEPEESKKGKGKK